MPGRAKMSRGKTAEQNHWGFFLPIIIKTLVGQQRSDMKFSLKCSATKRLQAPSALHKRHKKDIKSRTANQYKCSSNNDALNKGQSVINLYKIRQRIQAKESLKPN